MSSALSENIKKLMLENGIKNVSELAKKVNMRSQTLGLIIRGDRSNPREITLQPLADFFDVSINELLGVNNDFSFSSHLENIMTYCGINDYKLSEMSGIARETINSILYGLSNTPNDSTIKKLSDFFGITVDQMRGIEPVNIKDIENNISFNKIPLLYKRDIYNVYTEDFKLSIKNIYRKTKSKFNDSNQLCIESFGDMFFENKTSYFKVFLTTERSNNRQKTIYYDKTNSNVFLCKESIKQNKLYLTLDDIFAKPIIKNDNHLKLGYFLSISTPN
ncbi:helix-turn-helix transcriptional regulator [Francisella sp. SYW-9]|uniref:helix-turn-helix transcriptional regulator n=1 Tax=Francisella sp. SYW-9 TaxID=2610888 RepID=UPI00123E0423|nr:helix-turn-helix transcriptional regulator [Francisella sp. SYW-9]